MCFDVVVSCKYEKYPIALPTASVIIIFHNEDVNILLRSVYSVLIRSPPQYLKELVLVDDFSKFDNLKEPLDQYVSDMFDGKVRILRNTKREGLIRTRLAGAEVATGDVLIFLDSHIEVTDGWLEPLLAKINEDESYVVMPDIDGISDDTLGYKYRRSSRMGIGGFDWNLEVLFY